MRKKVLVCTGGTGGHIFPAVAFAEELGEEFELHFIGGKLSTNLFFNKTAVPFTEIACGRLSKNPLVFFGEARKIVKGFYESCKLIKRFQPDLVVGFGSYHTFPALLSAKWSKRPLLLHESNSIPGLVNRLFAPFAEAIAVQFTETAKHLRGQALPTRMPLRKAFREKKVPRHTAKAYFELDPEKLTLVVFGGSQGADAINRLVSESVRFLPPNFQVVHFTGGWCEGFKKKYAELNVPACVKPFETQMEMAWQAADLLIARAGASTIAELIEFEVPSLLIPYPHAADNHQEHNARFLVDRQAAMMSKESELDPEKLALAICDLRDNLSKMQLKIREYKSMMNSQSLADLAKKYL